LRHMRGSQRDHEAPAHSSALPDYRSAALATSPAADKARDSSALGTASGNASPAVRSPQSPGPRTR
jgi:hypothetical protein